jgi:hypothetical protein
MKIEINRSDYQSLLTVLEIADWVLHAYSGEESVQSAPLRALEQKVLSLADEFGCGELVEFDPAEQRYWLTREYDELSDAVQFIEQFENDCFWDQLNDRLVERDLMRQLGEKAFKQLDSEQVAEKAEPYRRLYGEEFLTHGVDRLEILQQAVGPGGGAKLS